MRTEAASFTTALRGALSLIALSALGELACRHSAGTATCPPCDGAFQASPAQQAQIEAEWQRVADQVAPHANLDFRCACFGAGASTSVEGRNLYLSSDWDLSEQTARAAHLAAHRRQPPWTDDEDAPCAARVDRALEREADAHALELDTRRALGVLSVRYPFEPDYFATPAAARRHWLQRYFLAHPKGDGVVPGFAAAYRARCP